MTAVGEIGRAERAERRREAAVGLGLVAPPIGVVLLLIVLPAIQATTFSLGLVPTDNLVFSTGQHLVNSQTPTLAVYRDLLASPFIRDDLWLTVWISLLSVILVAVVAYVLALYVRFGSGRLPKIVRSLYLIPMFVPVVIASYAAITFYVDRGVLAAILHALGLAYVSPAYKPAGVVITQVWFNIPFAVLMLGSGLDGIEQELIESAHDVGAGFLTVLWRIVLPMNVVPLLIVLTFTFIGVVGSFTIPFLIGPNAPQMMGVAIQAYFSNYNQPQAAVAMAVLLFLIAAAAGVVYVWATGRSNQHAVTL
ncbi:MAG: ABC transporter permease subunit [Chloroflexota bacterium]|nr:ABC transporter permease subunit [Chloroflexota bacterium]